MTCPLPEHFPARRFSARRNQPALLALILACFLWSSAAHGQIWWTGDGDGTTWSDAANWSGGVPGAADIVWLGYAGSGSVADAAQNINVDGDRSVARIIVFGEGNREVTVGGDALTFATGNVSGRETIILDENANRAATFHNELLINRRDLILQESGTVDLILNGDISPAPVGNPGHNGGTWEVRVLSGGSVVRFEGGRIIRST